MPNKPSKELLLFLQDKGVNTPEDIAMAKREYVRQYKKKWKQTAKKNKEIRATFTEQEYAFIRRVAELYGMAPTTYVRELALKNNYVIPHKDELLLILQKISMAYIKAKDENWGHAHLLKEAEQLLLRYINRK